MVKLTGTPDNFLEYLRESPLFSGIEDEEIEQFLSLYSYSVYKLSVNEELVTKLGYSVFVLSGIIATYVLNDQGERSLANLFKAEVNPLIPTDIGDPYPTLMAYSKKRSLVLSIETNSYMKLNPCILSIQTRILQNIVSIFYATTKAVIDRTICNSEANSRKRIIMYIKTLYNSDNGNCVTFPLTRKDLADHLRMDTSTLMRELKTLKNQGLIDYDRKSIWIKDMSLLS